MASPKDMCTGLLVVMTTTTTEHAALPSATLLRLIWLASPALPVGGFSYSEGLEPAVECGLVTDEATAMSWLRDQAALCLGRSELPLLGASWQAWTDIDEDRVRSLNDWVLMTRDGHEARQQTVQMGRSMALWLRDDWVGDARWKFLSALPEAPTWPVSWALAAVLAQAPLQESLLAFGFSWAENMVQAALKSVPLGQRGGQRILAALADDLPALVQGAVNCSDQDRQVFAPMLAILAAQHETQYSRLFRS